MPTIRSNKLYDRLKVTVQIILPALATLYFALAAIWGLPEAEKVVATITAFTAFLGGFLQISSAKFQADPDGHISSDGTVSFKQDALYNKSKLLVKVDRPDVKVDEDGNLAQ